MRIMSRFCGKICLNFSPLPTSPSLLGSPNALSAFYNTDLRSAPADETCPLRTTV